MSGPSDIEWTEATWNPVSGCKAVSPGCTNCYAQRMASRLQAMKIEKYSGTTRKSGRKAVWTGKVNVDMKSLDAPLKWKKPRRIFVNSMSDLFQIGVEEEFILRVWEVMEAAKQHTFQILTKRPDRMASILSKPEFKTLSNVWLGTSVESQEYLERIDFLRETPSVIRFISFEPLLGPILDPDLHAIHWAIVGGESGPGARPMEEWWAEELKDACSEQEVAFFFKQWGGVRKHNTGRKLKGKVWDEYPVSLSAV